ncbi:caspase family protein [Sinorhizobium meliloti]
MKFDQGRALVIGVANYQEVNKLPEAVLNDARDIANVLRSPDLCGYPENSVTVLLDDKATLAGIRKALAELAADAKPHDTVAIFFSGHGARFGLGDSATSALIPYDCRRNDALATTLGESELSNALAAIKASRLLVVVDACHAGGVATLKSDSPENFVEGFDEKSLQRLSQGTGRVVLASSRASETSLVLRGERNSVFTKAVLDGLRGGRTSRNRWNDPDLHSVQPHRREGASGSAWQAASHLQGDGSRGRLPHCAFPGRSKVAGQNYART